MKKSGVYLVIACLFLIFSCSGVFSYTFHIGNISINEDYAVGEALSGNFLLNLTNVSINSFFSSEFGEVGIREVFANDGNELSCEAYNCTDVYVKSDSGSTSKQILTSANGKVLGLYLVGEQVLVNDFGLNIASEFGERNEIPFSIKIANEYSWDFDSPSENWTSLRGISSGCFNSSATFTNKVIDSFGYCEQFNLSASRSYYLKANISGSSGIEYFKISFNKGGEELESCDFSVSYANYSSDAGCIVEFPQQIESGVYDICISSQEDVSSYTIKREVSGNNCGYYKNSANRTSDYSIYVLTPKYSSFSGDVVFPEDFSSGASDAINYYLSVVYPNGCTNGCTIPIVFYGDNITLNLSDIIFRHDTEDGPEFVNKINEVMATNLKIDYSGIVSFDAFNWTTNSIINKNVSVYLQDGSQKDKLFDFRINVHESPLVRAVYPMFPPAGVSVYFYADVIYNFSRLEWDFGDETPVVSTNGYATTHIYSNVSQIYNLTIRAYGENYSTEKSFFVETISPENYINASLDLKRTRLTRLNEQIDALPALYRDSVKQSLNITELFDLLGQIEVARTLAYSPDQFLEIVNELVGISVPTNVVIGDRFSSSAIGTPNSIDPSIVAQIAYGNYSNFDKYKSVIVGWQFGNMVSQIVSEQVKAYMETGQVDNLIKVYHVSLTSKANETAYFVIQKSESELYFETNVGAKQVEGKSATYFEITPGGSLNLEFFIIGSEDVPMFVSPELSSLSTNNIVPCNFNLVCQKYLGEDYKNCRSDCKPFWPTVFLIIILIMFILTLYTLLQIWYKVRYEKRLFSDRVFLFNLIAFINNSKVNGMVYGEIYSALSNKGWLSEQISYAIKKAEGRNTGMYELIPVEKTLAYFAMKKAEKNKSQRIAVPVNNVMRVNMGSGVPPRSFSRSNSSGQNFRNKDNFRKI